MNHPNADAYVNGPVAHHFETCGWRGYRPGAWEMKEVPWDICAGQSPLDPMWLASDGGAEGTTGYLAHRATNSNEFYNESTPTWWIPGRYYDLRETWCSFYLKEIEPISVADGYLPFLFVAAYMPNGLPRPNHRLSCWYLREPLEVGKGDWALTERKLINDPNFWVNYHSSDSADTLDDVLAHCGFIGWMYFHPDRPTRAFEGVNATGVMGWDEMHFNMTDEDLADLRAGRPLRNALVL